MERLDGWNKNGGETAVIKRVIKDVRKYLELVRFQEKWRKSNPENSTRAGNIFPIEKVQVGKHSYGILNVHSYNQEDEHLSIGAYCSIADRTEFMLGGEHDYKTMFTYPFKNRVSHNAIQEAITKGPIVVGDDVWIGCGCIILSGTKIGQGAVIGAGSIVSGEIPPYAIFAGGRVIKYRFSQIVIDKLKKYDVSKINWNAIEQNYDLLYMHVNEDNVDQMIEAAQGLQEG